jgi:HSP20 family protein
MAVFNSLYKLDNFVTMANFRLRPRISQSEVNAMAEWNPLEQMEALRREVDRAFEDFGLGGAPSRRVAFLPGTGPRRYPLINLLEDKDHIFIEALTPGVDPQSLDLSVLQGRLTISGEKTRVAEEVKPEAFHRNERASGRFVRTVDLPVEVDAEQIKAEYKDGLLVVALPKAEKAKPKQINIKVS